VAGNTLYTRTKGLLSEIDEIGKELSAGLDRLRGRLRISSPLLFAHVAMGRIAASFVSAYPEVRLEITTEDRVVDLIEEDYDLVIRINPRPDNDLVGRCFLRDQMLVVAPSSLTHPSPSSDPDAAVSVPAVVLTTTPEGGIWRISDEGHGRNLLPDPVLRLSSLLLVRDAVRAGAGAALLPRSIVADDLAAGRLVCWGEVSDRQVEVWVLHTSRRLVSKKVSVFVQFLCDAFPDASLR
jgi:DNA-binding transcriptional LysR family regulator